MSISNQCKGTLIIGSNNLNVISFEFDTEDMFGYSSEVLREMYLNELVVENQFAELDKKLKSLPETKFFMHDILLKTVEGKSFKANLNGCLDRDGNICIFILASKQFISTSPVEAEIYNNLDLYIYAVDKHNFNLLYLSPMVESQYPGEYINRKCYDFLANRTAPCDYCPLLNIEHDKFDVNSAWLYDKKYIDGIAHDYHTKPITWDGMSAYLVERDAFAPIQTDESDGLGLDFGDYSLRFLNSCDSWIEVDSSSQKIKLYINNNEVMKGFSSARSHEYRKYVEDYCEMCIHPKDKARFLADLQIDAMIAASPFVQVYRVQSGHSYHPMMFQSFISRQQQENHPIIISCTDLVNLNIDYRPDKDLETAQNTLLRSFYEVIIDIQLDQNQYVSNLNEFYSPASEMNASGKYSELVTTVQKAAHPDDKPKFLPLTLENVREYFSKNDKMTTEIRLLKDDEYHWHKLEYICMERAEDNYHVMLLVRSIDKEKATQKDLIDALNAAEAANKAKSDFLSRMSHDIRTPMNAIIGMTGIAKSTIHNKEKTLECLDKVEISSKYLLSLINDILDMSKIESGNMIVEQEFFDLIGFIEEIRAIVTAQSKAKKLNFKIRQHSITQRFVNGDSLRLKQVVINLLSNAMKFSKEGGEVKLSVAQKPLRSNWVNVEMIISDNGIGMSKEIQQNAFKPFMQGQNVSATYGGSGLGLSICHNLVHMMNGTISFNSEDGVGTSFIVNIPLQAQNNDPFVSEEIPDVEDSIENIRQRLGGCKCLLVEDDFINAEIALTILEECGLKVDTASNGKEAVEMFAASDDGYYDLILMDIQMPIMNGYAATEEIRKMQRQDADDVPIIAMTANAFIEDVAASTVHGMNAHLAKPIDLKTLYKTLYQFIK